MAVKSLYYSQPCYVDLQVTLRTPEEGLHTMGFLNSPISLLSNHEFNEETGTKQILDRVRILLHWPLTCRTQHADVLGKSAARKLLLIIPRKKSLAPILAPSSAFVVTSSYRKQNILVMLEYPPKLLEINRHIFQQAFHFVLELRSHPGLGNM